jgi:hypothetical protein
MGRNHLENLGLGIGIILKWLIFYFIIIYRDNKETGGLF